MKDDEPTEETKLRQQVWLLGAKLRRLRREAAALEGQQEFRFDCVAPLGFEIMNRRNKINRLAKVRRELQEKLKKLALSGGAGRQ